MSRPKNSHLNGNKTHEGKIEMVWVPCGFCSKGAEKYFRRSRLNWPEGAVSRDSIRAVRKLDLLKVAIFSQMLI